MGRFGGDDRFVKEYVESEFLTQITRQQRAFLTRAAVLERLSGPLCEAVLGLPGAAATLTDLVRSEPAAGAAGPAGAVYGGYHHLSAYMLLAELDAWSRA